MGVGEINPTVLKAYIKLMNNYKTNIHQEEAQGPDQALERA